MLGKIALLLVLVPTFSMAQPAEDMMAKLMKMQQCLKAIDQSEMAVLEEKSLTLQQQINSLCQKGKNAEAQKIAMDFGIEVSQSKTVKQVAKCADIMKGMIPDLPILDFDRDFSNYNICDGQF